jgi:hypothetical protein
MTVTVTHTKVSAIPDGADTTVVRPSDWNATHTLVGLGTAAELDAGVANGVATLDASGKVPSSQLTGVVTSVTGTAPVASSGGATPAISMAAATAVVDGYLTSTDWTTFNSKQAAGTYVNSVSATAPITSSGGVTPTIAIPAATASVNGYLTSADWTTFNNKGLGSVTSVAATVPSFLSITGTPITSSGTLAISYSGTALPIANGGTGLTALGTGVQTAIGVNVGTAGAFVVNGGALGTPSSGTVTNLTGTASININGTVGATTANTGAFTTLSTSGVATFSAGAVGTPAITTTGDTNTGIFFPAADTIAFAEGGAEAMRIDSSGNVGIGTATSASTTALTVQIESPKNTTFQGTGYGVAPSINLRSAGGTASSPSATASTPLNIVGATTDDGTTFRNTVSIVGTIESTPTSTSHPTAIIFNTTSVGSLSRAERMRISSSGNVGIGTSSPNYKLEISTDSAGKPGVGGLWTVVSDERIKSNIVPANLDRCYEIVKSVPLKHFGFAEGVYGDDQIQDKHNLGWIAQDVQKVFKNAVSVKPFTPATGDIIEDCLDLNGGQMIAALYGAVQALMAIVDTQAERITALEKGV